MRGVVDYTICLCVCVRACMHVCVCESMLASVCAYLNISVIHGYLGMYVCMSMHARTHTYTHMHILTLAHILVLVGPVWMVTYWYLIPGTLVLLPGSGTRAWY